MIALGCDVGNLFTKAVILDGDEIIASNEMRTTGKVVTEIDGFLEATAEIAGIKMTDVESIVATGNGASLVPNADFIEDQVNCAGAAAAFYLPEVDLAIGIGGQHITSMLLDEDGLVTNFMRNDKCASGSGRFIEVMSEKLSLPFDQIDEAVRQAQNPVSISNQCAVFAESEVISHVNAGAEKSDIFAGICSAVAKIVVSQGRRFNSAKTFTLVGGVARLEAVRKFIENKLLCDYQHFPHDPKYAAALGAALLADTE